MGSDLHTLAWLVNGLVACGVGVGRGKPYYRWQTWRHMRSIGAGSLAIVSVIAGCTGIILALQSAQQLERIGATSYVANLVGVTIIKELGPLLTAIILTGRSGAAFTAEIATMKIYEEIDALDVIGVDSIRFLVWPKLVAMLVMLPLLTAWADFVGIMCGALFSGLFLGINTAGYLERSMSFLMISDVLAGLIKALGFGLTITLICCWQGFLARQGAVDVGVRTTRSVVMSIFLIILLDLYFTALNYMFL
jgi:phospholipid/cholesterol/gamma-HCH transport system permease protein